MKVCLIDPSYWIQEKTKIPGELNHILPKLGLLYVASILEKQSIDVKLISYYSNLMKNGFNEKSIAGTLKRQNPDFILLSANLIDFNSLRIIIKIAKQEVPNCKIILGGSMASTIHKIILKELHNIDFLVLGEGEKTIVDLLNKLYKKEDFSKVKGIAYRKNNKINFTEKRESTTNLDELPLPSWHLVDFSKCKLGPTSQYTKGRGINMITSRGCPFNCIFCDKSILGYKWRGRSAQNVFTEIKLLYDEYKVRNIFFFDDLFLFDRNRVKDICKLIKKENLEFSWSCQSRVDMVDTGLLKVMKNAGCKAIGYGVEGGTRRALKLINKDITLEQVKYAIDETRKLRIETKGFFMLGFPNETRKEILDTIDTAIYLNPDTAIFSIVTPYPNTILWEMVKDNVSRNWNKFTPLGVSEQVYVPEGLSKHELDRLHSYALRKYYLRPRFFCQKGINLIRNPYSLVCHLKKIKFFIQMMVENDKKVFTKIK